MTDGDRLDPDELRELALDYCDQMMNDLGVIGIASAAHRHVPGEEIRRLPVETPGAHDDAHVGVGHDRILTDVRDYDGDDDVAAHDDVQFMTVRETTGRAAIYSNATLGLGWETIPTPREVRVAEFLEGIDERDLARDGFAVRPEDASEEILRRMLPRDPRADKIGLWVDVDDAAIDNVGALESCVTAVTVASSAPSNRRYYLARYADEWGTDDETTLRSRWSSDLLGGLVVEYRTERRGPGTPSRRWYAGHVRDHNAGGWAEHDTEADATGYATITDDDGNSVTTTLRVIPELIPPHAVLDLDEPAPPAPTDADD